MKEPSWWNGGPFGPTAKWWNQPHSWGAALQNCRWQFCFGDNAFDLEHFPWNWYKKWEVKGNFTGKSWTLKQQTHGISSVRMVIYRCKFSCETRISSNHHFTRKPYYSNSGIFTSNTEILTSRSLETVDMAIQPKTTGIPARRIGSFNCQR